MKTIKIDFVGFWPEFNKQDNFIYNKLKCKYNVQISENPDYVISSCFSSEYLKYDCIRIFYTGENISPDFNVFDYAIGYDYLQFEDRYMRLPNYFITDTYADDMVRMQEKHLYNENILDTKEEFCSFVVSKGEGYVDPRREEFFKLLCRYKKVNSGGRFLNNIGLPEGVSDKFSFQKKHKFAIAFENVSHNGYTTEKIVQAFAAKTVPIYWGDPKISEVFNKAAFIDCSQYKDFDTVISFIRKLDQDDKLYLKMLNTPALLKEGYVIQKEKEFEAFLYHIFDQEYEHAYRRDRTGYGRMHCDNMKKTEKMRQSKLYRFLEKKNVI